MNTKTLVVSSAGGALGLTVAFAAFGCLTWTLALAIVVGVAIGAVAMLGLSRIRPGVTENSSAGDSLGRRERTNLRQRSSTAITTHSRPLLCSCEPSPHSSGRTGLQCGCA